MDILMVAAELAPFAEETPAAEAVVALSKALRQLGHDVTIAMPRYPGFEERGLLMARRLTPLPLHGSGEITVYDGQLPTGVQLVLFDAPVLFERPGVYGEAGKDYADNAKRFGLLSQAAAALIRARDQQMKAFDLVHLHDWPAALVPVALNANPGPSLATVLTIHDVTRQGTFPAKDAEALGVPRDALTTEGFKLGTKINVLKGALSFVDAVTTLSPSYAIAAQSEALSGPVAHYLSGPKAPIGIVGGVDYSLYNPATDTHIESRYDAEDTHNKGRNKTAVLREFELEVELDPERPLVVCLGPLTRERGGDLIVNHLPAILKNDLSLIVAGAGTAAFEKKLSAARQRYPQRFAYVSEPSLAVRHRLLAAADFLVSASRHEPWGYDVMLGQRYGAVPVAHATGSICDIVVDCDTALETGTGFLFDDDTPEALIGALQRALSAYVHPGMQRLVRRVMHRDLSWDRPARRYLQVYRQTLASAG